MQQHPHLYGLISMGWLFAMSIRIDAVEGEVWMVCPSFLLTSQGWSLAFVQTQKLPWESQSWGNGNDLMRRDRK